ncbi:MAG: hypothetical protein GF372_03250 [Candidatus Marinimicrobia bacterium]|nr:hypothetical protein [Candidatus Neomarinimicrobiota bacterium]
MSRLFALISADARNIRRDSMMMLILAAPVIFILLLRYAIPWLAGTIQQELAFDLTPHYEIIFIFFSLLLPMLFGMITGFILLDEQDEHIFTFISVTPLSKTGYLLQKLTISTTIIFIVTLVFAVINGLTSVPFWRFTPIALLMALEAPIMALFLVAFAENKVEGIALSKVSGLFLFAPLAGYFVHSPLQYLAGISPTFWIWESYAAAVEGSALLVLNLAAGVTLHLCYLLLLWRKFVRKAI